MRLLVVNLVVVLVPVAGLEFARLYERQLLGALERDMRHQAVLVRRMLEASLERAQPLDAPAHAEVLWRAAADTRTRIRVIDRGGSIALDSHRHGPPEGPEPPAPTLLPTSVADDVSVGYARSGWERADVWPAVAQRQEVRRAFAGERASYTRVRERSPEVLLFLSEPVLVERRVVAVVYVARSTQPVLVELYRIRRGLFSVLSVAMVFTALVSLALAWTISRPLSRLTKAARRIARGERDVPVPIRGSGEIRELSESFATMTHELDRRMRYISEFAADVAHEFKSPLTSIRGAAELLGEGAADDPSARARFLRNIELDVERLDRLVSRLLELSRIEASGEAKVELDVVALARDVARRASTPDHEVVFESELSSLPIRAREGDLQTALLNLCDNAVRFSPPGQPVTLALKRDATSVHLLVADQGPGVPSAHREKVFDRFFTTDEARDGTGLGLAIASAVASAHGGELRLLEPDEASFIPAHTGAIFCLRLPLGGARPALSLV